MDPKGLRMAQNAYFSLLTNKKQLLLVAFCDTTAGNGASFWTHGRANGQTDGWTDRQMDISNCRVTFVTENSFYVRICLEP